VSAVSAVGADTAAGCILILHLSSHSLPAARTACPGAKHVILHRGRSCSTSLLLHFLLQIANLTSRHPRDGPTHRQNLNSSSARESLRNLFTHALRDPGDTPRKDVRRNSIDLSEVEDTPRSGRVMEERARNTGKSMSFSDEELVKFSRGFGHLTRTRLVLTNMLHFYLFSVGHRCGGFVASNASVVISKMCFIFGVD
jgi:hypothetical protein